MPEKSLPTFLAAHPNTVLVEIADARGSTPRDAGTVMLVSQADIWGTIGGGRLEFLAIDNARAMLSGSGQAVMEVPLGPEIGQCCGGRTRLAFSPLTPAIAERLKERLLKEERQHPSVFLFGAGHVGLALAQALRPLPLSVTVVETRQEALQDLPPDVARRCVAMPEAVVAEIPPGGAVVMLTHDHALDFLIAREALSRTDLAYVGMIGSQTKRATFAGWLKREGLDKSLIDRLVLPIGGSSVRDKRPAVIAALVAAELLTLLS
ncbi:xanthine dehydrogenase accessory factor [Pseudorhizobium tarimense]|uniref:Xanthine dehydrogenase accessory factor n=1 Tax=Pseudorhizobium tarimense TaxID=1079109 RepID=A0ABV2H6X9_9HYPH|nr:xanthine dehydrogenase accessory protein XdhC [Pseudorhizobium tarimense]MCJ8519477.1 xanthine dehydrogenase accessory protein XdhC [Pseudorhizobium tarimense]